MEHIHHKHKRGNQTDNENGNLNDLYLEKHNCVDLVSNLNEAELKRRQKESHVLGEDIESLVLEEVCVNTTGECTDEMTREVTEKPGEQNTAPIIPAYCNFQVARKMHVENLEHQPLPDSIMDRAFRRLQAQGASNPELALNVIPSATG